jgi:hypothetical protein
MEGSSLFANGLVFVSWIGSLVPDRRSVSFKNVEVREYKIVVGGPSVCCCEDNCSISLDWVYSGTVEIADVSSAPEQIVECEKLSYAQRRKLLRAAGVELPPNRPPKSKP